MWNWSAERRSGPVRLACVLVLMPASVALACDTREVAMAAASFNSCGTVWEWGSEVANGDLYACRGADCGIETVLRISRDPMNEADSSMPHADLLADWETRIMPDNSNGFTLEMREPISAAPIAGHDGALMSLHVTDPGGQGFNSLVFRIPIEGEYLVLAATGKTTPEKLRGFLGAALGNLTLLPDLDDQPEPLQ